MSAPDWRATAARWLRRGAHAAAGLVVDAALDSLELGKRALALASHAAWARVVVVAAVAIAVVTGAALAARGVQRGAVARAADAGPAAVAREAPPGSQR